MSDGYGRRLRLLRWRLRVRWEWFVTRHFRYRGENLVGRDVPDVGECHRQYVEGHSCPQDDGSHQHEWVRCVVTNKRGERTGEAYRCRICGGRKCDMDCNERRHHLGPHHQDDGTLRMVGK